MWICTHTHTHTYTRKCPFTHTHTHSLLIKLQSYSARKPDIKSLILMTYCLYIYTISHYLAVWQAKWGASKSFSSTKQTIQENSPLCRPFPKTNNSYNISSYLRPGCTISTAREKFWSCRDKQPILKLYHTLKQLCRYALI